jgi:ubiquinone/menaquinone biosynthesis C-methylase UbiE
MRVLDVGCGAGFNTLGIAWLVGRDGSAVAVDLEPRMLAVTKQRLQGEGLLERVELIESGANDLGLKGRHGFDFAVAFWMVHEMPDKGGLFAQLRRALKKRARSDISDTSDSTS